jgi:hypothetical protein
MDLTKIDGLVSTVAAASTEAQEARAAQDAAEVLLLETLVERVRPALKALSSRITTSERVYWASKNRPMLGSETTKSEHRGCRVVGDGPSKDYPSENRGAWEDHDLYLLTDGRWLELEYGGHWSQWQGEESKWIAKERIMTTAEVVDEYDSDTIVGAVVTALQKQADGNLPERSARMRDRAEKVRAVTTLLAK